MKKKIFLKILLLNYLPKNYFSKSELPNMGCSLSTSMAYLPVFEVFLVLLDSFYFRCSLSFFVIPAWKKVMFNAKQGEYEIVLLHDSDRNIFQYI